MTMKRVDQDRLLKYIDGTLSPDELKLAEELLSRDQGARDFLHYMQESHRILQQMEQESPSRDFTRRVMDRLHEPLTSPGGPSIARSLLLFIGIVGVLLIAVVLTSLGVFDQTMALDLGRVSGAEKYLDKDLPVLQLDWEIIINGIIMLNLILAFMVLDRAILKPYFQRRLQSHVR